MSRPMILCGVIALMLAAAPALAEPLVLKARGTVFTLDPATMQIDATPAGQPAIAVMAPMHAAEAVAPTYLKAGWRWTDAEGRTFTASTRDDTLHLTVRAAEDKGLDWPLPHADAKAVWIVPDGEGMAFGASDPFWAKHYTHEHCLDASAGLSFPAWSLLSKGAAVTYALNDGLRSELCLQATDGLQAKMKHSFDEGMGSVELMFAVRAPDPLAPALFYRAYLKSQGRFATLKQKYVPGLEKLYGAPQAYIWGDGRDPAFLDVLKALGIQRLNLSLDQNPLSTSQPVAGLDYMKKARAQGYLIGPYEAFDNGQAPGIDIAPYSLWTGVLYPAGCIQTKDGKPMAGFADQGCEMSSEAIRRYAGRPVPGVRYEQHKREGANQVFVDVDSYGDFFHDYSPDHPMTMVQDRANRLSRLALGWKHYGLVIGSENTTSWATTAVHYTHGTAQSHVSAVWPIQSDHQRFGGWWPYDHLPLFFKPFDPTPDEARALFGPADRLPLYEAVFHDSVIASDRWEFSLMKVRGVEAQRFATSLLYGTPTMWSLDGRELRRSGSWLKAAHDDFKLAHGWSAPVALTGFAWQTPDRSVQTTHFADGRVITANFGSTAFDGLGPDCVRVARPKAKPVDLCPPPLPAD